MTAATSTAARDPPQTPSRRAATGRIQRTTVRRNGKMMAISLVSNSIPGHRESARIISEEDGHPPTARVASSRAAIPPAVASPAIQPRKAERATVSFARFPWKRASKAASLCPQRSRQIDSPTDQAKNASTAAGRMRKIISNRTTSQVFCTRVAAPVPLSSETMRLVSRVSTRPRATTTRKIWTPRRTPISPS
jgi:hypothetical protein